MKKKCNRCFKVLEKEKMKKIENLYYCKDCWIDCDICGESTRYLGTKQCNNCYEIKRRLVKLLKSEKGKEWIKNKIKKEVIK